MMLSLYVSVIILSVHMVFGDTSDLPQKTISPKPSQSDSPTKKATVSTTADLSSIISDSKDTVVLMNKYPSGIFIYDANTSKNASDHKQSPFEGFPEERYSRLVEVLSKVNIVINDVNGVVVKFVQISKGHRTVIDISSELLLQGPKVYLLYYDIKRLYGSLSTNIADVMPLLNEIRNLDYLTVYSLTTLIHFFGLDRRFSNIRYLLRDPDILKRVEAANFYQRLELQTGIVREAVIDVYLEVQDLIEQLNSLHSGMMSIFTTQSYDRFLDVIDRMDKFIMTVAQFILLYPQVISVIDSLRLKLPELIQHRQEFMNLFESLEQEVKRVEFVVKARGTVQKYLLDQGNSSDTNISTPLILMIAVLLFVFR